MSDAGAVDGSSNKKLGEWLAVCAAVSVFIANAAAVISGIDRIRAQLGVWMDDLSLAVGRQVATLIVAPLALLSYAGICYLIYRAWIARRDRLWRLAFWILAATGATIPVLVTVFALSGSNPAAEVASLDKNFVHDLLRQQYSSGPQAGGFRFSTTDASDVAQPWTTAQALVALEQSESKGAATAEIASGVRYLIHTQTKNGGWGYMVGLPSDVAEVDAWSARALIESIAPGSETVRWTATEKTEIRDAAARALGELAKTQMMSGGWPPVLDCQSPRNARTYSTIMAISAFTEARRSQLFSAADTATFDDATKRAVAFILSSYRENGALSGWWPNPLERSPTGDYPGLTAQSLLVLEEAAQTFPMLRGDPRLATMISAYFTSANLTNQYRSGLAGRSISENDRPHDMESYLDACTTGSAESSTFLWFPWTLALASTAAADKELPPVTQRQASDMLRSLTPRLGRITALRQSGRSRLPDSGSAVGHRYPESELKNRRSQNSSMGRLSAI